MRKDAITMVMLFCCQCDLIVYYLQSIHFEFGDIRMKLFV